MLSVFTNRLHKPPRFAKRRLVEPIDVEYAPPRFIGARAAIEEHHGRRSACPAHPTSAVLRSVAVPRSPPRRGPVVIHKGHAHLRTAISSFPSPSIRTADPAPSTRATPKAAPSFAVVREIRALIGPWRKHRQVRDVCCRQRSNHRLLQVIRPPIPPPILDRTTRTNLLTPTRSGGIRRPAHHLNAKKSPMPGDPKPPAPRPSRPALAVTRTRNSPSTNQQTNPVQIIPRNADITGSSSLTSGPACPPNHARLGIAADQHGEPRLLVS